MTTAALDAQLSELLNIQAGDDLASELDPNFRPYPIRPPYTSEDSLDSGIAGPDVPDLDPEFSRPSQGLDSDDDPAFSQMPLPDDFTVDNLTEVTKAEFAPWQLLAQFPYLLSMAIKCALEQSKDMDQDQRYQVLHDAKVYLVKAIEYYDPVSRPYLFTEYGFIKGTQLGAMTISPKLKQASIKAAAIRLAFARSNFFISKLLDLSCNCQNIPNTGWGLSVKNLQSMLKAVEEAMQAIINGRNRQEIKNES